MSEFIHKDGTIKTEAEIRSENPNTAFPKQLTKEILKAFDYTAVIATNQPTASSDLKIIIRNGVEKNSNGDWVEAWKEVDRFTSFKHAVTGKTITKASQEKEWEETKKLNLTNELRKQRIPLLEEADWQIHKIEDASGDASKWKVYRQELRDITKDITKPFPKKPS
tara:strand:- start:224 stop:721 length:498 start_codon:yes stop_codon:yes gene_type:complete